LSTDGAFHDKQRRLIQPAFSKKRVDSYADMIVSYTRDTMARWQPHTQINIADDMEALILRIIAKILADIDITNQASKEVEMVEAMMGQPVSFLEGLLNLKIDLPFTPYGKRMAAKRKADGYIYELIDKRRAENRDVG